MRNRVHSARALSKGHELAGKSVSRIARDHGVSEDVIGPILDQRAAEQMTEKSPRRSLMLELQRLDDPLETFHPRALEAWPAPSLRSRRASRRRRDADRSS